MAEAINKQVNESKLPAKPWTFNLSPKSNNRLDETESCRLSNQFAFVNEYNWLLTLFTYYIVTLSLVMRVFSAKIWHIADIFLIVKTKVQKLMDLLYLVTVNELQLICASFL
jgi:hypothetical protein